MNNNTDERPDSNDDAVDPIKEIFGIIDEIRAEAEAERISDLPQEAKDHLAKVKAKGAFQRATIVSHPRPAAASKGHELTKQVEAVIRTGIDYANLGINADTETGGLPWGEWVVFPYIIRHKDKWYGRLHIKEGTMRVRYFVDGDEVGEDIFNSHLTPSAAKAKGPRGGTITPLIGSITLG